MQDTALKVQFVPATGLGCSFQLAKAGCASTITAGSPSAAANTSRFILRLPAVKASAGQRRQRCDQEHGYAADPVHRPSGPEFGQGGESKHDTGKSPVPLLSGNGCLDRTGGRLSAGRILNTWAG